MIFGKWMVLASLATISATALAAQPSPNYASIAQNLAFSLNSNAREVLNWKVGDKASYKVAYVGLGYEGTLQEYVASDEGTALWVNEDMEMMGQSQKSQMLMNKGDGRLLKLLVNGQEQQLPTAGDTQVVSQEMGEITVAAGKFQCVHVVAKSSAYPKIEVWMNPRDTVMSGLLKQLMTHPQYGDIVMELQSFSKAP